VREEAAELIRAAVPNVEAEVNGIRALWPPTADEAELIRVVGGLERTARLDEKFAESARSGECPRTGSGDRDGWRQRRKVGRDGP